MPTAADTWTGDDFEIAVDRRSGVDVVRASGELDIATASRLRSIVLDPSLCTQPGLVVDLTGVSFLDSTGIGVLVAAWRHSAAGAKRFGLACAEGQVMRVLKLVGLHELIDVWPTADDAVAVLELR